MSRKYTKVEQLAEEIRRLHEEGKTYREIGGQYGLNKEQVVGLMKRQRRKQRLIEHGCLIRPKGHPQKEPGDEAIRIQNELARLRMQVELLQNFLYEESHQIPWIIGTGLSTLMRFFYALPAPRRKGRKCSSILLIYIAKYP